MNNNEMKKVNDYYKIIHQSPPNPAPSTSNYSTPKSSLPARSPASSLERDDHKKTKTEQTMDEKLNLLLDMATKNEQRMDNLTNLMNQNTEKITQMNTRINEFENALNFTAETSEENKQKTDELTNLVTEQANIIQQLSSKVNKLEVKLKNEADKRDRSEAVGRRQNFEISGIPPSDPEPRSLLKQRVLELAQALVANITLPDIEDAHRKRSEFDD